MLCTLCANNEEKTTRFIPLYVFGSEGLNVCHECEMQLVEFARLLRFNNMRLTFVKLDNSVVYEQGKNKHKLVYPDNLWHCLVNRLSARLCGRNDHCSADCQPD